MMVDEKKEDVVMVDAQVVKKKGGEYVLKKAMRYLGVVRGKGYPVVLSAKQAERLKKADYV